MTRTIGQTIRVDVGDVRITILVAALRHGKVRIGVQAPREVPIRRGENEPEQESTHVPR